ncbi:MAG TPA: hypothetical protein VHW69_05990 [Rhizomicrobium sp.]|nr:hypothetical protein [Rhizomicrobium sp.]
MQRRAIHTCLVAVFTLGALSPARADLSISKKATHDVSCSGGVCTATAKNANLNVSDLTNMLATGDLTVQSGNDDNTAAGIEIIDGLSWTSISRLTLTARHNIIVKAPITVAGQGAFTLTCGTANPDGDLLFEQNGKIDFWDLNSSFVVNGTAYLLLDKIATLASAIQANHFGHFAFAKDYDASIDGTYSWSPVRTKLRGTLNGLGHTVANLKLNIIFNDDSPGTCAGLFSEIGRGGGVVNFNLTAADLQVSGNGGAGILACHNFGLVAHDSTSGEFLSLSANPQADGGMIVENFGAIEDARANVRMNLDGASGSSIGELAAVSLGTITSSFSKGSIRTNADGQQQLVSVGAIAGFNVGVIENSYSATTLVNGSENCCNTNVGGLVGSNTRAGHKVGKIIASYAAGQLRNRSAACCSGGVIGSDAEGKATAAYWDLDTGIKDPSRGAGNISNDPGITGLTDAQLKSGLPDGFDPKIWGQSPSINNGYPYLLANPPPK